MGRTLALLKNPALKPLDDASSRGTMGRYGSRTVGASTPSRSASKYW